MPPWHEDDALWEDLRGAIFTSERIRLAATDVEQVLTLLKPSAGATLLDLGCGVGRHSLEFARRGFRVTGVDRCDSYLAEARKRAAADGLKVEWVHNDMRRFRRSGAFDAAVCLLTSFGYFENAADDQATIENVYASLKPGGTLLIDLMGREVLAKIFRPRDWHEEPDGTILLEERAVTDDWHWLNVRWILLKGERRIERRFRLHLFTAADLATLLRGAGFEQVRCYGALTGSPYDQDAQRLVVVGHKPTDQDGT